MSMRIVVIGGTGPIGSKLVAKLTRHGHEAIAAAPEMGVDTLTGDGLAGVLRGASVVVDVSSSPSFEDAAARERFTTSTRNLLVAAEAAGVGHHVLLSMVGTNRLSESGYFRAKSAQEELVRVARIPSSIVRATQLFEFVGSIAQGATEGDTIRVAPALVQPIAADDAAGAVGGIAVGSPMDGIVEIAGPEQFPLDVFIGRWLSARHDPREVVIDQTARYFGASLDQRTLLPWFNATIGTTHFVDWLYRSAPVSDLAPPVLVRPEASGASL